MFYIFEFVKVKVFKLFILNLSLFKRIKIVFFSLNMSNILGLCMNIHFASWNNHI